MALVSWNCHGFKQHVSELRDLVNTYHPACIAVQETFLRSSQTAKLRRYSTFRNDNDGGERVSGGVALFVSQNYPSCPFHINTELQAVAIQIHIHSLVTICSLYLPPNTTISQISLHNLINQLPVPFIVLGDFNGHSPLWGSPDLNHRGKQIEKVLSEHDLSLFNTDEKTYFHSPSRSFHSLDLAICSPSTFPYWRFSVDSYLHNSDHFPIVLTHMLHSKYNCDISRYILHSADWKTFTELSNINPTMVDHLSIDESVKMVTNTIISAADATIRKTSGRPHKQSKPWWNEDCRRSYKENRKAFNIFKRYPTAF